MKVIVPARGMSCIWKKRAEQRKLQSYRPRKGHELHLEKELKKWQWLALSSPQGA